MSGGDAIKAIFCFSAALLLFSTVVQSEPLNDTVANFVKAVVDAHGSDLLKPDPPESPPGGYVFRFELFADKEESTILFVASSLDCEKSGCYWTVFHRPKNGNYTKIRDAFFLPSSAVSRSETEDKFIYSVLLLGGREGNALLSFSVSRDGLLQVNSRKLSAQEINILSDGVVERPTDETLQSAFDAMDTIRKSIVARAIQKVKLKDLQSDNGIEWKPVNNSFPLSEQYRDPANGQLEATPSPRASEDTE